VLRSASTIGGTIYIQLRVPLRSKFTRHGCGCDLRKRVDASWRCHSMTLSKVASAATDRQLKLVVDVSQCVRMSQWLCLPALDSRNTHGDRVKFASKFKVPRTRLRLHVYECALQDSVLRLTSIPWRPWTCTANVYAHQLR